MMNNEELLALFDVEQRRDVIWPDGIREATPEVVRHRHPQRKNVVVLYSDLSEATADPVIRCELAYAEGLAYEFVWKLYTHDRPADLAQRLLAHGLSPLELEAVLV